MNFLLFLLGQLRFPFKARVLWEEGFNRGDQVIFRYSVRVVDLLCVILSD